VETRSASGDRPAPQTVDEAREIDGTARRVAEERVVRHAGVRA